MSDSYPVNNYYYNPPYNHWAGGRSDSLNKWKINYKGSIAKASDLPNEGEFKGDTYDVLEDGSNYMWNGSSWDKLDANVYIGATSTKNGIQGLVPPATSNEREKFLKGDGTWGDIATDIVGTISEADREKIQNLTQYPRITSLENFHYIYYDNTIHAHEGFSLSDTKETTLQIKSYRGIDTYLSYYQDNSTFTPWLRIALNHSDVVGDGIKIVNNVISVPEYEGATASATATSGLVPPALSSERECVLKGDGTWLSLGDIRTKLVELETRLAALEGN